MRNFGCVAQIRVGGYAVNQSARVQTSGEGAIFSQHLAVGIQRRWYELGFLVAIILPSVMPLWLAGSSMTLSVFSFPT
jgi:hypothetical protein